MVQVQQVAQVGVAQATVASTSWAVRQQMVQAEHPA